MKDERAPGPIGLDYGITGLIVGQSSDRGGERRGGKKKVADVPWMLLNDGLPHGGGKKVGRD